MTRVALYARYSSDNQSVASIDDQFRICRDQAARERWKVVSTYKDAAISGASVTLRPGIQALLQDAQAGKFDIVLAEALDRVSRDQADVAILYKNLKFSDVRIVTLAEGEISELHVGLKGTMNALFLKDLAAKTHRGLRGRVEKGKAGGGLCYGYDLVKRLSSEGEQVRGERNINEAEAVVVRRIFREFAAGTSPRAIAAALNGDGIPGPLGRAWGDTSIRGHVCRGTGILNNELYAGVLVWNRMRYIKNPATGKRVSRVNPESEWIRTEVPELRIVDEELWQAARQRQTEIAKQFENVTKGVRAYRAQHVNELRRPSFLFSGLLTCGSCGGHYGIITRDRYGCLNRYRRGTCDNGHTIRRDDIESRVLAGLAEKLVSAGAVGDAVRTYAEELNRQNHERRAHTELDRKALAKVERGIAGIMAAIEDGMYQPAMKARMDDLERQKAEIMARMAEAPADVPDIHPNIAEIYKAKVVRLTEALADPELHSEAADAIRSLVGEVVLTPGEKRGEMQAVLRGELMGILDFVSERWSHPSPEVITKGVAGPRNQTSSVTQKVMAPLRADLVPASHGIAVAIVKGAGRRFDKGALCKIIRIRTDRGESVQKGKDCPGEHEPIVDRATCDRLHGVLATNAECRATRCAPRHRRRSVPRPDRRVALAAARLISSKSAWTRSVDRDNQTAATGGAMKWQNKPHPCRCSGSGARSRPIACASRCVSRESHGRRRSSTS